MRHVVIAGYGVAGLTVGDSLRQAGFDGDITIVGEEPRVPYSRPALSKAALAVVSQLASDSDVQDLDVPPLPDPTHDAAELLGRRVVGLNVTDRKVILDDSTDLTYDRLVVATGSRARRFTDSSDEFTLRTLEDAILLKARLVQRPRVTVLGGGPLGMEVASGARDLGCEVTVIEPGTPMERQIGPFLANICTKAAQEHGVRVIDAAVRRIIQTGAEGDGVEMELSNGRTIETEVVVSAIGDEPNDAWLTGSGLLTDGRAVVDNRARLRHDVVAVGDVAWLPSPDGPRRQPFWTSAIEQGKAGARGLLHDEAEPLNYQPYFWTEQFGLNLKLSGTFPALGVPRIAQGSVDERRVLLQWEGHGPTGTAAAVNFRIPIPRLRRLAVAEQTAV